MVVLSVFSALDLMSLIIIQSFFYSSRASSIRMWPEDGIPTVFECQCETGIRTIPA